MCANLKITPADWTVNRPVVLACYFSAHFMSHLRLLFSEWEYNSASSVSAPTYPRRVSQLGVRMLLGTGKTKHKSVRNIGFRAACFPCLRRGQYMVLELYLGYVLTKLVSSTSLGFHSQVPTFYEINTVQ